MPETVPTIDEIYWRAYAAAIKRILAPGGIGPDIAVFVAPQTQRGIAAGKFIPESVTNNLVYNIADDLLPGKSPLYVPGGAAKYTQQLGSYLNWAVVNSNPSTGALLRLTEALNKLNVTQDNLDKQLTKALDQFSKYPDKSVSFEIWCTQYGQAFLRARQANLAASGAYDQALMEYWGPDAASLVEFKDRLKLATNILSGNAGYNMFCTLADLNDVQALWEQSNGGNTPVGPSRDKLFYRPAFSVQTLGPAVEEWIRMFGKQTTTISVDLDVGRNTKWEELGFTKVDASASVGYWFVFSITVTYEGVTTTKNLKLKENEKQINMELICNGVTSFPVGAGAWDIPGVKTLYPALRKGAPEGLLTSLIRTESVLIAYGVGAKITFNSSVKEEVHNMLNEVTKVGGSAKVFGWDISAGAGGSRESSRNVTFDDVQWDRESGTMTIPSADNGYPTLLGVLGRRL